MRLAYVILFSFQVFVLVMCIIETKRSYKPTASTVSLFVSSLILPIIGNLVLIATDNRTIALIGCYAYFIGMDMVVFGLMRFTVVYCQVSMRSRFLRYTAYAALILDVVQYALNPFLKHAFDIEQIEVDGYAYYRLVPYIGQAYHRVVCYVIFFVLILVPIWKIIKSPKIYWERYLVLLGTFLGTAAVQAYFIFSRTPIDRSMVAYGISGIVIYYFAIHYRPMRLLDRMLADFASEMDESLFFFDADGKCIWANKHGVELAQITDKKAEQAIDSLEFLFGKIDINSDGDDWSAKRVIGVGSDASYYTIEKHTLKERKGKITGYLLTIRDNTEEQRELQREMYNATHDSLTSLYIKEYLYECISNVLFASKNKDKEYVVVFVDALNFKVVNDVFGNSFGDSAIISIAEWIRKNSTDNWVYGRLIGATFGILAPKDEIDSKKLGDELERFMVNDGNAEFHVMIQLGFYEITKDDTDVSAMFDKARLALVPIQENYSAHVAFYDDSIRNKVIWDQHITNQLVEALRERQIRPYFQSIVNRDGKIVGAEALARWLHPEEGFLSPSKFIPVFEQNGMIIEIDKYMWRCACEILAKWGDKHNVFVSVNISPKDFYFMDVAAELRSLVKEYNIDPGRLRVEITETVMMDDVDNRMQILNDLKDAGFIVEMDDFGSGYSSLNLLKEMPVDVLKIDMNFLNVSSNSERAQTIVNNIIKLSEDLEISSLTEGVETEYQFHRLSEMGCKLFQGYYFSKPIPLEDFEKLL